MHCHITILRYLAILRIVLDIRGFVSVGLLHNAGQVIKTNVSQLKLLTFLTQFKLVTLSHGPAQPSPAQPSPAQPSGAHLRRNRKFDVTS